VAFLANNGEPVQPLLRRAGLPGTCLDDPKTLVPTAALWRFRELAAIRTGLPNLALTVMAPLELPKLGAVGRALLRAPTLLGMIHDFQRIARAESSTAVFDLIPLESGDVFFSLRLSLRKLPGEWQAELYLLMWMLKIVWLVETTWSPEEIWFTVAATPDRLREIESITTRPRFNRPCTGFPIPARMLALPRASRESSRRRPDIDEEILWSTSPSDSVAGAIKQMIRAYAGDRWLTLAQATDVLCTNPRTMQRQLSAEGKTFSGILEETRAELAGKLLEDTDASLSEIADRLGYSNLSNFNRAFRRWSVVSPREFRAQRGRH
jgi:AraC-like DNA-binding protein